MCEHRLRSPKDLLSDGYKSCFAIETQIFSFYPTPVVNTTGAEPALERAVWLPIPTYTHGPEMTDKHT